MTLNYQDIKRMQQEVSYVQEIFQKEGQVLKETVDNMLAEWKSLASIAQSTLAVAPFPFKHSVKMFAENAQKTVDIITKDLNDPNKFTIVGEYYVKNKDFDMDAD